MKDKKPIVIGVLSVILLVLISYIVVAGTEDVENGMTEESPSEEQQPEPETEPNPDPVEPDSESVSESEPDSPIWYEEEIFELPIIGAAGYPSVDLPLYTEADTSSQALGELSAGTPFEIQAEQGDFWFVRTAELEGWLEHRFAFVNLPDVVPSIIYDNTNSYDSKFQSSSNEIPELTGESLYDMQGFNNRLDRDEFIMPVLYQTAEKVAHAQRLALENNESLIMVETFRPRETQLLIVESLTDLAEENEEVEEGITEDPWSITWFINTNVSNHQRGLALDVSLAQVDQLGEEIVGDYHVPEILDYTKHEMQTPIHELSAESAIFERPIATRDRDGWRELDINPETTDSSLRMQSYLVEAGFTPIASEWWHFNDLDALEDLDEDAGTGEFEIYETLNSVPSWEEVEELEGE